MTKILVGVLGQGGAVGQHYVQKLKNHPYFELTQNLDRCALLFSALPDSAARQNELKYAKQGRAIFSSAACHRLEKDVPLIIPEINPDHLTLIRDQQKNRGWKKGGLLWQNLTALCRATSSLSSLCTKNLGSGE